MEKRRKKRRKRRNVILGSFLILTLVVVGMIIVFIKQYLPSKEKMDLVKYYGITDEEEVVIVLQDEVQEQRGFIIDKTIYLNYNLIVEQFNKRFYWDSNESILVYTTPTEVIKAEVGSQSYFVNKNKKNESYQIVRMKNNEIFLALDFIKQYSDLEYKLYENPNRVVIEYKWGDYLFASMKKNAILRYKPDVKSEILTELKVEDEVMVINSDEVIKNKFSKVITKDGIVGYVKTKSMKDSYYKTLSSDFEQPVYTNISKEGTISLVWHQVTVPQANDFLLTMLAETKGVTTIAPTWFSVLDTEGNISSLADSTYVQTAHNQGLEVWALIEDLSHKVDMLALLSRTSVREKLENELISYAIRYNLDGLNIDFETISAEAASHYLQFIRELSIKCRNNGIVLSIDNYVPMSYSAYYDRKEQGIVADYVITMAYDEHYGGSPVSGSVSSIDWVRNGTINTLKEVPKEKTIIALPFYTRLWIEEDGSVSSKNYIMSHAEELLKGKGIEPVWDTKTMQYYAEYMEGNTTYKMWLEEETSLEEKLKVIMEHQTAGVAFWKLGQEKDEVWKTIIKYIQ